MKKIGIVAHSADGGALCFITACREGQNLLGTAGGIIAAGDHSFDHRVPARQILGVIDLDL